MVWPIISLGSFERVYVHNGEKTQNKKKQKIIMTGYIVVVLATALRFVVAVDNVNLNGLWNIKNSSSGKLWICLFS